MFVFPDPEPEIISIIYGWNLWPIWFMLGYVLLMFP